MDTEIILRGRRLSVEQGDEEWNTEFAKMLLSKELEEAERYSEALVI